MKSLVISTLIEGGLYTFQYTGDKGKAEAWLEHVRTLNRLPEFITEATYGKSSLRLPCDYSGTEVTTFEGERTTVGIVEWEGKEYSIVTFMFGPLEIVPLIMDNELKKDVDAETYLAIVDLIEPVVLEDYPEGFYISRDL